MNRARRAWLVVSLVALAVAVVSTFAGRGLGYDPTAWAVWARALVTGGGYHPAGGPSWKPLPMLVLTPLTALSPGGGPILWLGAVRASAAVAVVVAGVLGRRLSGRAGAVGSAVAVAGLLLGRFGATVAFGLSEPIAVAAVLAAALAWLRRSWLAACGACFVAALARPEAWPLLVVTAVLLWRRDVRLRARLWAATAGACLPMAWLLPDWLATGDPLRSMHRDGRSAGPSHAAHPALAVLSEAARCLPATAWVLVAVAVAIAWRRRDRATGQLLAVGIGWIAMEAAAAAAHLSSSQPRYLAPALALLSVCAGSGVGVLVHLATQLPLSWRRCCGVAASCGLLAMALPPQAASAARAWTADERWGAAEQGLQHRPFVARLPAKCLPLATGSLQVPAVAWAFELPLDAVRALSVPSAGTAPAAASHDAAPRGFTRWFAVRLPAGGWTVWRPRRCAAGRPLGRSPVRRTGLATIRPRQQR